VVAPRDGIVFRVQATEGTFLRAGSAMCTIIPVTESRMIELWLDGGHNPHGALAIERALTALRAETPRPTWVILGVLNRKDLDGVVAPLARVADVIVAVPVPNSAASRDPIEVRAAVAARGTSALIAATCDEALASAPAGSRVLICGSLYLAGAVLAENDPPV
jgi:dihydrofolate synthase/folylpolyglutamate synthase